jgi:hypothetical protein
MMSLCAFVGRGLAFLGAETGLSRMCYFLYLAGKGKRGDNTQLATPDLRGWFIGSC